MTPSIEPPRPRASLFFAFVLGVAILASPARVLWAQPTLPWWAPFVAWLAVIIGGGLASAWWDRGGRD